MTAAIVMIQTFIFTSPVGFSETFFQILLELRRSIALSKFPGQRASAFFPTLPTSDVLSPPQGLDKSINFSVIISCFVINSVVEFIKVR